MKTTLDFAKEMGLLDGVDHEHMMMIIEFARVIARHERNEIARWLETSSNILEKRSNENEHMGKSMTPIIQTILNTQRDIARSLRDGEVS